MTPESIARIIYAAVNEYRRQLGEPPRPERWEDAGEEYRAVLINDVEWRLRNLDKPLSTGHARWVSVMLDKGWRYGPVEDPVEKTNPCLRDWHELPAEQQAKQFLYSAICSAMYHSAGVEKAA